MRVARLVILGAIPLIFLFTHINTLVSGEHSNPPELPANVPSAVDERFGVVVHTGSKMETEFFLNELGVNWYLDFNSNMSQIPAGANKVPFIQVPTKAPIWESLGTSTIFDLAEDEVAALGFTDPAHVRSTARSNPGTHWYIFGEPNKFSYMTGDKFAQVFKYYVDIIKIADPTAKIIAPSVLNWDFECIGCAGYQLGWIWIGTFISSYQFLFEELPPVDLWAIDIYPIDWVNVPNNDPAQPAFYPAEGKAFQHWEIAVRQLVKMREFLNLFPQYADTPIWITEIAVHIGYDGWRWNPFPTQISPEGEYRWELMGQYLISVLDWLEINAAMLGIEKWFFFITWKDIVDVGTDGYMGITLFNGQQVGASLNCLGETYHSRATDNSPKRCDAVGNTVPDADPPQVPSLSVLGAIVASAAFAFLVILGLRKEVPSLNEIF